MAHARDFRRVVQGRLVMRDFLADTLNAPRFAIGPDKQMDLMTVLQQTPG